MTEPHGPAMSTGPSEPRVDRAAIIENAARELIAAMFRDSQRGETYTGRVLEAYSQLDLALAAVPPAPLSKHPDWDGVAGWMMKHGYATGHGDTIDDMLDELEAQAIKRAPPSIPEREKLLEAIALLKELRPKCCEESCERVQDNQDDTCKYTRGIDAAIAALEGK